MSDDEGMGSGVFRILGFIGIIVLLNGLSYAFDWGFFFY